MAVDTSRDAAIRVMTLVTDDRFRAENFVDLLLAAAREDCRKALLGIPTGPVPKGTMSGGHALECASRSNVLKHMPCDCPFGEEGDHTDRIDRIAKALEKAHAEGLAEGRQSTLTDRQREAFWRLLENIGSWTSSRYDQHLRHDVGDVDTDAILDWLRTSVNSGIGDPDVDGPPGDPVPSDMMVVMPVDYHRCEVAKLLIAAGLRPDMDVAEAVIHLELMAGQLHGFGGQRSAGPVDVHQVPCERGARGECETCQQEALRRQRWLAAETATGKKPVPKGTSFVPQCIRCAAAVTENSFGPSSVCKDYPKCTPFKPNPGRPGSQYCARKTCRHTHKDMLRCTQCDCMTFLEIHDVEIVWHLADITDPYYDGLRQPRCGAAHGVGVYITNSAAGVTCPHCLTDEASHKEAPGSAAKTAPPVMHLLETDRSGRNRCGTLANPATTREENVTCLDCKNPLAKPAGSYKNAGQVPKGTEPDWHWVMHWLVADGVGKTYCGLTQGQGEDVYGTTSGAGSNCPACLKAAGTSVGYRTEPESKPKLEEGKWVLDKDAVARAHGWTWWSQVVEDSQKDGYTEAGGMGNLAAAIGRNAAYAQKLIELVDEQP